MPAALFAPHPPAPAAQKATGAGGAIRPGELFWLADEESNALPVFTLVVWLVCLFVGALGFVLHYERPRPRKPPEAPVIAQQLQVELAPEPLPPPDAEPPPPDPLAPPPPPDALAPPAIAQPIAVAQPGPAIAFALPVAGPTRVVDASRAEYASRATNTRSAPPSAQPLILGEGEGNQPEPVYPRRAVSQRQEGTVIVRLAVAENGQVLTAEAVEPSPWPLLNEAALKVVRERWHFRSGPPRVYEVAIRFELAK